MIADEKKWLTRDRTDRLDLHRGYACKAPRPDGKGKLSPVLFIGNEKRTYEPKKVGPESKYEERRKPES
jgi:hypothetical protein